jgi:hypothetical protein
VWATCLRSASSGFRAEFHEGYQMHTNPLNCRTSSSGISGYHADYHEGQEWQGAAWHDRGTAWARQDMCELAFTYILLQPFGPAVLQC